MSADYITFASDGTASIEREHPDENADCTPRCGRCNGPLETRREEDSELCLDCMFIVAQEENL